MNGHTMLCDSSNNVYFMHQMKRLYGVVIFPFSQCPPTRPSSFIENCAFNCKNKSKKSHEKNGHNVAHAHSLKQNIKNARE